MDLVFSLGMRGKGLSGLLSTMLASGTFDRTWNSNVGVNILTMITAISDNILDMHVKFNGNVCTRLHGYFDAVRTLCRSTTNSDSWNVNELLSLVGETECSCQTLFCICSRKDGAAARVHCLEAYR